MRTARDLSFWLPEEGAVALVPDGWRSGATLFGSGVVLPNRNRRVHHAAVLGRGEGNRRFPRDVISFEPECCVADFVVPAVAVPADIEAHVRRNRLTSTTPDAVSAVVIVVHRNVARVETRPPGGGIDLDR